MCQVRTVDVVERRARLALRHCLAPEAQRPDPTEIARAIVCYHATDPASVYLSAAARGLPDPAPLDQALYERRSLVRMLGMRRTMFVVPTELVPVVQAACTNTILVRERKVAMELVTAAGIADPEAWYATAAADTLRALAARGGEATTSELAEDVPALRAQVVLAAGKPYQSKATLAPRVLYLLGAEGRVVRGRPVRSWVSNYRWSLAESWLPEPPAPVPQLDAETELARRWLAAFGPGTLADLKWWTGWTVAQAKRAVAKLGAVTVDVDGSVGYLLPEDGEPVPAPAPWTALLPSLDPAVMGWAMPGRDWFLGERCRSALYDRSGNLGPTVWWDGRVVGGWVQRSDGGIVYRLLEEVPKAGRAAIEAQVTRLAEWLGTVRVTPRFRTPLERELTGA
jgi:hypothetical protein